MERDIKWERTDKEIRGSIQVQSNIRKTRVPERLEKETRGEEITTEITQEKFP